MLYNRLIHQSLSGFGFDMALCRHLASASAAVLGALGFSSGVGGSHETFLFMNGWHVVSVGWQCDGLPVMALFTIFIVAYPGPWRAKLWFIPAGLLAIHLLNILRIVGLAFNQVYSRSTTEFNHHYTFTIIVYGFIFWLWTIWVRRFARQTPDAGSPPPSSDQTPSQPGTAPVDERASASSPSSSDTTSFQARG